MEGQNNKLTLQQELFGLYEEALAIGKVSNKKDFALFIGISPQTLSNAFAGGDKLTQRIVARAKQKLRNQIVVNESTEGETVNVLPGGTKKEEATENGDLIKLMQKLVDSYNKERESHERIVMAMLEALKK